MQALQLRVEVGHLALPGSLGEHVVRVCCCICTCSIGTSYFCTCCTHADEMRNKAYWANLKEMDMTSVHRSTHHRMQVCVGMEFRCADDLYVLYTCNVHVVHVVQIVGTVRIVCTDVQYQMVVSSASGRSGGCSLLFNSTTLIFSTLSWQFAPSCTA